MKQTLEEAAYDYATHKTKFRKDVLKEVDADNYVSRHDNCMEDFQCGEEWQSKQSPWISVEERLPEEDKEVLVLYEFRSAFMIQEDFYFGQGEQWNWGGNKILAWMPIPSFDEILEANRDVLERIKEKGD